MKIPFNKEIVYQMRGNDRTGERVPRSTVQGTLKLKFFTFNNKFSSDTTDLHTFSFSPPLSLFLHKFKDRVKSKRKINEMATRIGHFYDQRSTHIVWIFIHTCSITFPK